MLGASETVDTKCTPRNNPNPSGAVPLLARVYPNGMADVNHFHAAGGLGYTIKELLDAGLLHEDVRTILGDGLRNFCQEPFLDKETLDWRPAQTDSLDTEILRPVAEPFDPEGGLTCKAKRCTTTEQR